MKHLLFVASVVFAAAGCKQEVAASVACKVVEGPAAECTITQTKGTAEFEVCWDFKVSCQNGATLEAAKTCAKVGDGKTVSATTPKDKIKLTGECDVVKAATVTGMTVNGEPSK